MQRVLLVGWDAADWKIIRPLIAAGHMPALQALMARGTSGNLATLSPILSPMLWTSIATGKRPFKHGVHGFVEPAPDGKSVRPVTSMTRTTRALWNILTMEGRRSHVVGWWPSHPAEPIAGTMVSNQYQRAPRDPAADWPLGDGTVHPQRLAETLGELRFHPSELDEAHLRLFVPEGHRIDQDKDRRLDSLMRMIADCTSIHAAATHLIAEEPWDFAAIYYDAIDHFGHGFMKYHPPRQAFVSEADFGIYNQVVSAGYVYHDLMLARLLELAGEDTTVLLISDHGFHPDHLRPEAMPMEPAGPAIEHREQGIFVAAGPGIRPGGEVTGASLLDVAPTILTLFGLPVGADMDGRPLTDILTGPPPLPPIPSWDAVEGEDGRLPPEAEPDPEQARAVMEQLVALGYVDRPSDDGRRAVAETRRDLGYNLALSYMDAGMHPKAAELLTGLYRDEPLEFRFGIRLALCLQAMDRADAMARVIDHLNRNWRKASEKAKARLDEIREIGAARRADAAALEAEIAATDRDEDPDAPAPAPGGIFSDEERQVIRRLRAIARGNPQTLDRLTGSVAAARGDRDAARAALERARAGESSNPAVHLQLGNACLAQSEFDAARASYAQALALDPDNAGAHLGLCRVALKQDRVADARAAAERAIALKHQSAPAHFFHGLALRRAGDLPGAISAMEQALALNPNFPQAHALLARMHGRLGDLFRAVDHRRQLRQLRAEARAARDEAPTLDLPEIDEAGIAARLPAWPAAPSLLPPLLMRPAAGTRPDPDRPLITVVSGLPRSGTSMAMQMLVAGGLDAHTDADRGPDASNPRGYVEHARVKRLATENDWLPQAAGRALKVVTPLLPWLPQTCRYRVIVMERDLDEIVASQSRMLERLDRREADLAAGTLRKALAEQRGTADAVLAVHDIPVLRLDYHAVIRDPGTAADRIAAFLGGDPDRTAMAACVDPALWRERAVPPPT